MKLKFLTPAVIMLASAITAGAQCSDFIWSTDPAVRSKQDEAVAIYGDAMRAKNYRGATKSLQYMINTSPKWNTKLYIDGAEIYDELAEKETDPARRKVFVDSLMLMYDMRITNCGDQINVLNRKGYAMFKFARTKEKVAEALTQFDKICDMSGDKVFDGNLVAYMKTIENNQKLSKNLTDDQILAKYDKIMEVISAKVKAATASGKKAEVDKLKSYEGAIESILLQLVQINCDFVRKNLAPKFKQNPNDLNIAKKIFTFMLKDKCTDDPLWLEATETIDRLNPEKDFGIKKILAVRYMNAGTYEKAATMLKEALALATTAEQKSDINVLLGSIEAKNGNNSAARSLFLQAGSSEGYEKIGDLYYNSFDDCKKGVSVAEDRLVYIAAYEMYQKAGSSPQMARAKAQFPSTEEIFLLNWQKGSTQKVGCWINEAVTLKTRD